MPRGCASWRATRAAQIGQCRVSGSKVNPALVLSLVAGVALVRGEFQNFSVLEASLVAAHRAPAGVSVGGYSCHISTKHILSTRLSRGRMCPSYTCGMAKPGHESKGARGERDSAIHEVAKMSINVPCGHPLFTSFKHLMPVMPMSVVALAI